MLYAEAFSKRKFELTSEVIFYLFLHLRRRCERLANMDIKSDTFFNILLNSFASVYGFIDSYISIKLSVWSVDFFSHHKTLITDCFHMAVSIMSGRSIFFHNLVDPDLGVGGFCKLRELTSFSYSSNSGTSKQFRGDASFVNLFAIGADCITVHISGGSNFCNIVAFIHLWQFYTPWSNISRYRLIFTHAPLMQSSNRSSTANAICTFHSLKGQ